MDILVSITNESILAVSCYSNFFYVKWNDLKRLIRNITNPVNVLPLSRGIALTHSQVAVCPHSKVDSLASLVTSSRVCDVAYPSCCLIGLALEMKNTNQMMYHV